MGVRLGRREGVAGFLSGRKGVGGGWLGGVCLGGGGFRAWVGQTLGVPGRDCFVTNPVPRNDNGAVSVCLGLCL